MPEGDTILKAANQMRPVLEGHVPDEILTPHPRFGRDRWPERLRDRCIERISTHGKHLLIHFGGDLVVHSHLRMTGSWDVHPTGSRWRRAPRRAWLVLRAGTGEVVQFDGPVLELLTAARARSHPVMSALGPDVLAPELDRHRFVARLRADDQTRPIGDALIDQHVVAGLGTVWRSEGCWDAQLDPWRRTGEVTDEEALAVLEAVRPRMLAAAEPGARMPGARGLQVYGRSGRPCRRCGTEIRFQDQGENARQLYWCPGCQS